MKKPAAGPPPEPIFKGARVTMQRVRPNSEKDAPVRQLKGLRAITPASLRGEK